MTPQEIKDMTVNQYDNWMQGLPIDQEILLMTNPDAHKYFEVLISILSDKVEEDEILKAAE